MNDLLKEYLITLLTLLIAVPLSILLADIIAGFISEPLYNILVNMGF